MWYDFMVYGYRGTCDLRLTLQRADVSTGYIFHPGLTYIFNFWHSGTLALSPERQSAWMSEIKNVG